MARRLHYLVGIVTTLAFLAAGAYMMWMADLHSLKPEHHLLFVSRHIYMLGPALINLVLATYARPVAHRRVRRLQSAGTILVVLAALLMMAAFVVEPIVIHERSRVSALGIFMLWGGTILHVLAPPLGRWLASRDR